MPRIDINDTTLYYERAGHIESLGLAPCLLVGTSGGAHDRIEGEAQ